MADDQEGHESISNGTLRGAPGPKQQQIFTAQKFVFDAPLYEEFVVGKEGDLFDICAVGRARIDGFCLICKKESVFHSNDNLTGREIDVRHQVIGSNIFKFTCTRCHLQQIVICALVNARRQQHPAAPLTNIKIRKIGQWPSFADLANKELNVYSKILSNEDRRELGTANGIAAHGVSIGAYVYLRRVFERLIHRAFDKSSSGLPKEEFMKLRMPEKVDTVKSKLPEFVSRNSNIYSILSKGIHELDENNCSAYFEVLRETIMIMLDHEKAIKNREEQEKKIAEALKKIDL